MTKQIDKFERLRKSKDHRRTTVTLEFDVYAPKHWKEDQIQCFAIASWGGSKEDENQKMFSTKEGDEATMVMV